MNIRILLLLLMLVGVVKVSLHSQSSAQLGLLPAINLNTKLNDTYKLNFKTESRLIFYKANDFKWDYELIDLTGIVSRKVGINNTLALGYLVRSRDGNTIHRLIQQFAINQRLPGFRMSHRFSTDQTFVPNKDLEVRLRYRLSNQFPLNGQSVNAREFYLKVNNEYLNSFQSNNYDLEIRLVIMLGYELNDNNKIELGLDNRLNSFIEGEGSFKTWIGMNWFLSL